jgi:NAD(P)-dependent dehydrogenase (short-subunit alcohol dehydrogenase family)
MASTPTRTVVVTGASAGVGRAVARSYGARGYRVALLARGTAGLEAAAKEVDASGGQSLVLPVDVSDHVGVFEAAARTEEEFGPIDIWVNDAFSSVFAPVKDLAPEEIRRVTEVSYLGFVYGTMAALERMRARDQGTIVQVGSALAYRGIPLQAAYCGAKHAIQGFTESLRCELLHDRSNVSVTMVQLPAMNTPQFTWVLSRLPRRAQPVPPIYQPEIGARAVVFAGDHPARREYWVGASTVGTLLANAVAPGVLDRYLALTGFDSQQTAEPHNPDQPVNLWQPADSPDGQDYGAQGRFSDAHTTSPQVWASQHHGALMAAGGLAALAAGTQVVRRARA